MLWIVRQLETTTTSFPKWSSKRVSVCPHPAPTEAKVPKTAVHLPRGFKGYGCPSGQKILPDLPPNPSYCSPPYCSLGLSPAASFSVLKPAYSGLLACVLAASPVTCSPEISWLTPLQVSSPQDLLTPSSPAPQVVLYPPHLYSALFFFIAHDG